MHRFIFLLKKKKSITALGFIIVTLSFDARQSELPTPLNKSEPLNSLGSFWRSYYEKWSHCLLSRDTVQSVPWTWGQGVPPKRLYPPPSLDCTI